MVRILEFDPADTIDPVSAAAAEFVVWNRTGTHPPLVLIRTWIDEIPRHQSLVRVLDREQPVWSMGHPVGDRNEDYPQDTDRWVDFCLERLDRLELADPVRIGGWSFGGVVALEVARRLVAAGRQVALVVLLDTRIPKPKPAPETQHIMRLGNRLQKYALVVSPEERRDYRRKAARRLLARSTGGLRSLPRLLGPRGPGSGSGEADPVDGAGPMDPLTRAIRVCYLKYRPEPTTLPILHLRTEESRRRVGGDISLGWSQHMEGELHIVPIPGGHHSIFEPEHVGQLVRHLEDGLARTRQPSR